MVGGSVALVVVFGVRHVAWAVVIVVGGLLVMALEGATRMGEERDVALASRRDSGDDLGAWLDERIREAKALQSNLRAALVGAVPDLPRVRSVEESIGGMNEEVVRRLHVDAPGWVAYYEEDPPWFNAGLTRLTVEQFKDVDLVFGYTTERLAHIRDALRSAPQQPQP